jgi:transposase-like protein
MYQAIDQSPQIKEMIMSQIRAKHNPQFKAKVALAAIKNEETIAELSKRFGVHPTMISRWKKTLLDSANNIFDKPGKSQKKQEVQVDELYRQIGQLKVERDFLAKGLSRLNGNSSEDAGSSRQGAEPEKTV